MVRITNNQLTDNYTSYVNSPVISEELVQDLFLNIWYKRKTWGPKGTIQSYLYKGAKNRALDYRDDFWQVFFTLFYLCYKCFFNMLK
jgi:DNA-directed RNA polymerase specialized sigma24 family protein